MGAKILNDCRVYDTATKEWSESLVMNGVVPPTNREKSTGVLYKDSIIVYGGYYCCCDDEREVIYNDIYIFNTKSMLWSKPNISEENSPPRFAHTSTIHEDQMLVFGGISSTTPTKYLPSLTQNRHQLPLEPQDLDQQPHLVVTPHLRLPSFPQTRPHRQHPPPLPYCIRRREQRVDFQ